jgi:hypothetical protein
VLCCFVVHGAIVGEWVRCIVLVWIVHTSIRTCTCMYIASTFWREKEATKEQKKKKKKKKKPTARIEPTQNYSVASEAEQQEMNFSQRNEEVLPLYA